MVTSPAIKFCLWFLEESLDSDQNLSVLLAIIDASPIPMAVNDDQHQITLLNRAFIQTFGYTRSDIPTLDQWWPAAYPDPEYRQQVAYNWRERTIQSRQENTPFEPFPVRIRCKDGRELTVVATAAQLGEQFHGYHLVILVDVTEQLETTNALANANSLLQTVIETIPLRVFWKDRDLHYLGCNSSFAKDGGGTKPEDIIGKDDYVLTWKEQAELYRHDDRTVMESGQSKIAFEEPQTTADGHHIWLRTSKMPLRNTANEIIGVLGLYEDITEQKKTADSLKEAIERYEILFNASPIALCVIDCETLEFLAINDAALKMYHYNRAESASRTLRDLFFDEDFEDFQRYLALQGHRRKTISTSIVRHRRQDGSAIWVEVSSHELLFAGRRARIFQGHDVSKRLEVENKLRSAEMRYRMLFDASPVPIGVYDTKTFKFLAFNDAALQLYGYNRDEAPKLSALDMYFQEDLPLFREYLARELAQGVALSSITLRNRKKDGSAIWVEIKAHPIDYDGHPARIVQVHDITQRLEMERELRSAEAHYRLLFDTNPVALGVYDPVSLQFLSVNDAAIEQYGYSREEFIGMSVLRIFLPEEVPDVVQHVAEEIRNSDRPAVSIWKNRKKDGTVFWVQLVGHSLEFMGKTARIVLAQDITQIKLSQLREQNRSEVLEMLAKAAPLKILLETITRGVEQENPSMLASILLLDETGDHLLSGAAPSLPEFYNEAIHGVKIGMGVGSCGTAAFTGKRVIVGDIQNHPYWSNYREIAAKAGLGSCWSNPIRSASGKILGTFAIYHHEPNVPTQVDIELIDHFSNLAGIAIERHQTEEALQLAALVYQNSSEGMLVTDGDNRIIAINPAFISMTGYQSDEVLGKDPSMLGSQRQDQMFYQTMWESIFKTGKWQGEIWNRRKNGDEYAEWLTINTIYNQDGSVHRRVALFSDITDKKRTDALIWNQANFDTLTQLPNRRLFRDRLEMDLRKAHRDSALLGLLFIDMDRFKEVNDTLGHHMGDELLIQAAHRIQRCVRESDSVARLGGDEFTVILPDLNDIADIGRISNSIIETLAKPFQLGEDQAYISASIGITVYPEDATTVEDLLKNADQAMYEAKRAGRNRYSYFTASMQEAATMRMRLVQDIHQAMALGQFMVYFQPIVDAQSGRIYKAEALLRWKHPQHGFISPAIFIPIAEDTGLIQEIGDWVFREAVRHLKTWRKIYDENFQVSINKSPVQFRSEDRTHNAWIAYLKEHDIPGENIVIEITEGLLLHADNSITSKLLMFRDAGIQVAIDDFGTGYSSLSYLKKFDIDYLKIDQSFIRNLDMEESDLALSEAIIVMAHKLGLKVIAEGVETESQRDILKRIDCDYLQGYLYSRPLPAEAFGQLLAESIQPA